MLGEHLEELLLGNDILSARKNGESAMFSEFGILSVTY